MKVLCACEESQAVIWKPISEFEKLYEVSSKGTHGGNQ
jgi:hypothetical protein